VSGVISCKAPDGSLCGYISIIGCTYSSSHIQHENASISADLNTPAGFQWLQDMTYPSAIVSGALSIMHPQLYEDGMRGMSTLEDWSSMYDPVMNRALSLWPTAFTNISLIANQSTPLHRDPQSRASWYDVIVNVGEYTDCVMAIPTLGIQLVYKPGTAVAFSGRLLRHGVNAVEGNWYCLTYYMRDNIHQWAHVPRCADWMRINGVEHLLRATVV